jgi:glycosyltransferase involved in cell wall biosynthesis
MQPELADVSVIIPAYRAAATIGRALDSVAAQTTRPRQILVVDDGSDDGTYEAALALVGTLGGIEVKVFRRRRRRMATGKAGTQFALP